MYEQPDTYILKMEVRVEWDIGLCVVYAWVYLISLVAANNVRGKAGRLSRGCHTSDFVYCIWYNGNHQCFKIVRLWKVRRSKCILGKSPPWSHSVLIYVVLFPKLCLPRSPSLRKRAQVTDHYALGALCYTTFSPHWIWNRSRRRRQPKEMTCINDPSPLYYQQWLYL